MEYHALTFEDLDATQDLYYPEAMLKVKDRSNESVTDTLKIALDKNWKYEEIIEIGNMFSIDIMSEKYVIGTKRSWRSQSLEKDY